MKYIFEMNSRANLSESAESKHNEVLTQLSQLDAPWGIVDNTIPLPDFGEEFFSTVNLTKYLGKYIRGTVSYRYRRNLDDSTLSDDRMYLEFNVTKIDYANLINEIFPRYITLFDAYFGAIYSEELIFVDFEKSRSSNNLKEIRRFYPILFLDNKLSERSFGLQIDEILCKLRNINEGITVTPLNKGLYINNGGKLLSIKEANQYNSRIYQLLGIKEK